MELQSVGTVTIEVEYYDALKKAAVEKSKMMEEQLRKEYNDKMLNVLSSLEKSLKSILDYCNKEDLLRINRNDAVTDIKDALWALDYQREKIK